MWVNQDESDLQTSEYDICAWLTCTTNNRNVKIWGIKITTYTIHYACVQYVVSVIVSRSFFTIWRCRTKHWIDPGVLAICVCVCVCVCACVCVCVCARPFAYPQKESSVSFVTCAHVCLLGFCFCLVGLQDVRAWGTLVNCFAFLSNALISPPLLLCLIPPPSLSLYLIIPPLPLTFPSMHSSFTPSLCLPL